MIGQARAEIVREQLAERERQLPDRMYRQVSRLIDLACDQVERVNLAGGGACPPMVADLVGQLDMLAGRPSSAPASSHDAHERLLDLSSELLGRPTGDLVSDMEAAR